MKRLSPGGYAVALHLSYSAPAFLFQTYPPEWSTFYAENGLMLHDPTVQWGVANLGYVDWADLADKDPQGVLIRAAEHGLHHGFSAAVLEGDSRSLVGFARSDRAFTQAERDALIGAMSHLHEVTLDHQAMPKAQADALRALAVNQSLSV